MKKTTSIHHVSAIVGNPKETVAFYSSVLGLRLIKKTVNFDDPGTYHLYFGDETGSPGTIMTFFPWPNAYKGTVGTGQVGTTFFQVDTRALDFWLERLQSFNIEVARETVFDEETLYFSDPHGLSLGLIARSGSLTHPWASSDIPDDKKILGFAGAQLLSTHVHKTSELVKQFFGFEQVAESATYTRFKASEQVGHTLDIKKVEPVTGSFGVGTVHHIAFRAKDEADQLEWQNFLMDNGYPTTEIKDRDYFKAMYFKEHGDIIMEIATDTPGFSVDEPIEQLGEKLQLPEWLESKRILIEHHLPPLS
ncbi:VOC family protein [Marinilactibacillus sp. XAAS-LB27]|uniref:VOC family protein n=1 Tax=Marinilactibacillus sp. XAAS-LB27 TaxID=3114538 RepID=UPI002E1832AF|nr:VOC family protein [Marinilactibacillus sp. XAAS-LB27]